MTSAPRAHPRVSRRRVVGSWLLFTALFALFFSGGLHVSMSPAALSGAGVGFAGGLALGWVDYRTTVGRRIAWFFDDRWPLGVGVVFATIIAVQFAGVEMTALPVVGPLVATTPADGTLLVFTALPGLLAVQTWTYLE